MVRRASRRMITGGPTTGEQRADEQRCALAEGVVEQDRDRAEGEGQGHDHREHQDARACCTREDRRMTSRVTPSMATVTRRPMSPSLVKAKTMMTPISSPRARR